MYNHQVSTTVAALAFLGYVMTSPGSASSVDSRWSYCTETFLNSVHILPLLKLNKDIISGDELIVAYPPPKLTVQGVCSFNSADKYGVSIRVKLPVFDPEAEAPGQPSDPIPDSDEFDHIQIYFANEDYECNSTNDVSIPCHRITELRFNRFHQYRMRLLSNPYQVLQDINVRPEMYFEFTEFPHVSWTGTVTFEVELLPRNFNRIAAFIIDPTQEAPIDRYYSQYRLYNHPISIIDLQVVSSYKKLTDDEIARIVRKEDNDHYSSYWEGL